MEFTPSIKEIWQDAARNREPVSRIAVVVLVVVAVVLVASPDGNAAHAWALARRRLELVKGRHRLREHARDGGGLRRHHKRVRPLRHLAEGLEVFGGQREAHLVRVRARVRARVRVGVRVRVRFRVRVRVDPDPTP